MTKQLPYLFPSRKDWSDCKAATLTFKGAWGSYNNYDDEFTPDHGMPFVMNLVVPITLEQAEFIWRNNNIDTKNPKSEFNNLMASNRHSIDLRYFKLGIGILKRRWVGNVTIVFGPVGSGKRVNIGSVGGASQHLMLDHFRRVLAQQGRFFAGTLEAIAGAGLMGD